MWFRISEKLPKAGDIILGELIGNKVMQTIIFRVREGEGLGHISRWKVIKTQEGSCEEARI